MEKQRWKNKDGKVICLNGIENGAISVPPHNK